MKVKLNNPIFPQNINFINPNKISSFVNKEKLKKLYLSNPFPKLNANYFHPSICTNGVNVEKFSTLLDEAINNPKSSSPKLVVELNELLKKIFSYVVNDPENLMGSGYTSKIYAIDNKYVIKVNNEVKSFPTNTNDFEVFGHAKFLNKLKTYYGEKLAQCLDWRIIVLKNADPYKIGTPFGIKHENHSVENVEKTYNNWVKKLSNVAQNSFDNVTQDMKTLDCLSPSYYFDYKNPNNFLLVGNEIRTVDDLECCSKFGKNNLSSILGAFIANKQVFSSATFDKDLVPQRRMILKKCILGNEKSNLSLELVESGMGFIEAMKLSGYDPHQPLILKLQRLRKEIPDVDKRLEVVEKYIDSLS